MFSAVHGDRSGRLVVAANHEAAMFDGTRAAPLADPIALPAGAEVVPLPGRVALGLDRSGRAHPLGTARWAVGAILPPGSLRTGLPAYVDDGTDEGLPPRPYAAVGASQSGALVVAAVAVDATAVPDGRAAAGLAERVSAALRAEPSNRLVRQLARCAREYRCRAAANAFAGAGDRALPVGAPANEHPPGPVALFDAADATPTEPAAFHPDPSEIAAVAVPALKDDGAIVVFGRECEGEPLLAVRTLEPAIEAIRERTRRGTIHLETNGSIPAALKRLCDAGLDSVAIRLVSARPETFEAYHRPDGFRLSDVRASLAVAIRAGIETAVRVLVLPGLTDRPRETDALVALAGEIPEGGALILRDLAADPLRALRIVPPEPPSGVARMLDRLRSDASHLRITSLPRPLVRS